MRTFSSTRTVGSNLKECKGKGEGRTSPTQALPSTARTTSESEEPSWALPHSPLPCGCQLLSIQLPEHLSYPFSNLHSQCYYPKSSFGPFFPKLLQESLLIYIPFDFPLNSLLYTIKNTEQTFKAQNWSRHPYFKPFNSSEPFQHENHDPGLVFSPSLKEPFSLLETFASF